MLTEKTAVLIFDEDRFYADGLRHALRFYGHRAGQTFRFVTGRQIPAAPAVIFFTLSTSHLLPPDLFRGPRPGQYLVCIAPRHFSERDTLPGFGGIPLLHREAPPASLAHLLLRLRCRPQVSAWRGTRLSPQEIRVLRALRAGRQIADIALQTGLSVKTLSTHKRRAMQKLGIDGTYLLYCWARGPGRYHLARPERADDPQPDTCDVI